jgi:hypothetical protein
MPALLNNVVVTAAVTNAVGPTLQVRSPIGIPTNVGVQVTFAYGSGGTSGTVWLQTSFDGGATWCDVAAIALTLANLRTLFNVSSLTPKTTAAAATDGTLAAGTINDGIVGSQWRCKYTTVGVFAGNTNLSVDMEASGVTSL